MNGQANPQNQAQGLSIRGNLILPDRLWQKILKVGPLSGTLHPWVKFGQETLTEKIVFQPFPSCVNH